MKKLLLILLCFPLIYSCKTKSDKEDIVAQKSTLNEKNIKGKVKKITEKSFYVSTKFGEPVKDSLEYINVFLFDKSGNQTELQIILEENGNIYSKHKFKYDENRNCILKQHYDNDNNLSSYQENKYDEEGNQIERNYYRLDTLRYKVKMKYNNGNCIIGESYNQKGNLTEKYEKIYDTKGKCIEMKSISYYDDGDKSITTTKYKYDKNENVVESNSYDENGEFRWNSIDKIEYDSKGNWITLISYSNSEYASNRIISYLEREIEYYK